MTSDSKRFKIALKDNGLHSFWKGIEAYKTATKGNDWNLKEAIMFIHHGIELLMKQILVNHSPYLIFEDLSDAAKKQKQADQQNVGVFFLDRPPRSVTYMDAIQRVEAFVAPKQLDGSLVSHLQKLNNFRNQIEHYAIDIEKEDVMKLLGKLHEPLIDLFDSQLGIDVRKSEPVRVTQAWRNITSIMERAIALENRVAKIAGLFKGQEVVGNLFGTDEKVNLPVIKEVFQSKILKIGENSMEIDIIAEGEHKKWVVEVKATSKLMKESFYRILSIAKSLNAVPWLVFIGTATKENLSFARSLGIYLSDQENLSDLEKILQQRIT